MILCGKQHSFPLLSADKFFLVDIPRQTNDIPAIADNVPQNKLRKYGLLINIEFGNVAI